MQMRTTFLVLGMIASSAFAEEALSEGGRSPDGAYEVRIKREKVNDEQPSSYGIDVYRAKSKKRVFILVGGHVSYEGAVERDHSYWHGSSEFVAITDEVARHSRELYVVDLSQGKPVVMQQPDFWQNALGRIDAVAIDFASVVNPKKWEGDDLILEVYFTANRRRSYTFEVVLHLSHELQAKPYLILKSVKKLKEEEG